MMPVTGPYTRTANPIRGVPGGGLPWIITAGNSALKSDGRLLEHVRGLVLADQARFRPRCRAPTRSRSSTPSSAARPSAPPERPPSPTSAPPRFPASTVGNADINATVSLPHPCIAPSCSWPRPSSAGSQRPGGRSPGKLPAARPRRVTAGRSGPLPAPPALRHVRRQPVTLDNLARTAGQGA